MTGVESLLIVLAQALIVFAVAEYEGANLKVLNTKKMLTVCLIFFMEQLIAMGLGYAISLIPFIRQGNHLHKVNAAMAAVLFLAVAAFILYRTWKWRHRDERLRELQYKRIALEAVGVAAYTLIAGVGCGLMHLNVGITFLIVFLATCLAVVTGLQTGYAQGDRFHRQVYATSCALFAFTGIRILIRWL